MDWWEHVRRCRRRAQARPAMSLQLAKPSPCNCILSTSTHPIQSATLTEHTFARFLHRHCFQLELRIEVPSLSVSALLLPPSIRYKVQDLFNEFKFKHSFWKLFLVLSFKRVFLREKKRKSRVAAESLGGVQARLESSITKVGRTWSHWY